MTNTKTTFPRRMFLRGAGGAALALPFLSSLAPRTAGAAPGEGQKRFVAMATEHGGIWNEHLWPSIDSESQMEYAGRTIRHGRLAPTSMSGQTVLSPMLTASAGTLTPSLIGKMNVLRGIDVPWYLGHHTGGHLGNYARNDGNGTPLVTDPHPTLDQILAWSPNFYTDLDGVLLRSMVMGRDRMSYMWSNPTERTGELQAIAPENSSLNLFGQIYTSPDENEDPRTPAVDHVLESYRRLRQGNRRLSAADRRRLDDHMERIFELQRRANVVSACTDISEPTENSRDVSRMEGFYFDPDLNRRFWQLQNDVIATAFACGSSAIATMNVADHFSTYEGDWHQDVAHQARDQRDRQMILLDGHRRFFEDVFLDLAAKLDALDDGDDATVLDNTLIQWTHESGPSTHNPLSIPVITAGSAGNAIQTGHYVDFGNLGFIKGDGNPDSTHPGITHNQWLGMVARAMGLERAEYDLQGHGGFGYLEMHSENDWFGRQEWWAGVDAVAGQDLPILS